MRIVAVMFRETSLEHATDRFADNRLGSNKEAVRRSYQWYLLLSNSAQRKRINKPYDNNYCDDINHVLLPEDAGTVKQEIISNFRRPVFFHNSMASITKTSMLIFHRVCQNTKYILLIFNSERIQVLTGPDVTLNRSNKR